MIIYGVFTLIFWGITLYSFIGLFSLIRIILRFYRYDELERRTVVDAFAISMGVILVVHLVQLVLSFTVPVEIVSILSPGRYLTGGLISNDPVHVDSFLFDCAIIGLSYRLRSTRYGLTSKKQCLLPIVILLSLLCIFFLTTLIFM